MWVQPFVYREGGLAWRLRIRLHSNRRVRQRRDAGRGAPHLPEKEKTGCGMPLRGCCKGSQHGVRTGLERRGRVQRGWQSMRGTLPPSLALFASFSGASKKGQHGDQPQNVNKAVSLQQKTPLSRADAGQGQAVFIRRGLRPFSYLITALMRRTPAEEDSSFWILKEPRSPVFSAWGPPQISKEYSPIL